jgi:hypothetical protein
MTTRNARQAQAPARRRTPAHESAADAPLSTHVSIASRYQRAAHIVLDRAHRETADGYVVSPLVRDAAFRLLEGLGSARSSRAWALVGPYGTGKSSFLNYFVDLAASGPELREQASRRLVGAFDEEATHLASALRDVTPAWLPVLVSGTREPIALALLRGLAAAFDTAFDECIPHGPHTAEFRDLFARARGDEPVEPSRVLRALTWAAELVTGHKTHGGLLVVIDELGKLLEFAAQRPDSSDILFMQELAALASRSDAARFAVVVSLHQAFNEYAASLPRASRLEWSKVEGRYETIPFIESPRHLARLVAGAIEQAPAYRTAVEATAAAARLDAWAAGPGRLPPSDLAVLHRALPLHPLTALSIGALFRTRVGQNERSLFAFLTSSEPHGFRRFVDETPLSAAHELYGLDRLYDYLIANVGPRNLSATGERGWAVAESALARLPDSATETDARLLKVVALLGMVGAAVQLTTTRETLVLAVDAPDLDAAIARLEAGSALVHRARSGTWLLWDGSDLDVNELIEASRRRVAAAGGLAPRMQRHATTFPVVASRHYLETGTLRHLVPMFVGMPGNLADLPTGTLGDGDLCCVVPDRLDELADLAAIVRNPLAMAGDTRPRVVAIPVEAATLLDCALEVFAIQDVLTSTAALAGDVVARRELQERLLTATDQLEAALGVSFFGARDGRIDWFWNARPFADIVPWSSGRRRTLSALASTLFDRVFDAAPRILNELVNREELSTAAAAARRDLLGRLMTHAHLEELGIEGHPPELAIHRSIIAAHGLHRQVDGVWRLGAPEPGSPLAGLWQRLDDAVARRGADRISFATMMGWLAVPPLGLRAGVAPVLLVTWFLTRRDQFFVYEDGSFVAQPSPEWLQRLLRKPSSVEIQAAEGVPGLKPVLAALRSALPEFAALSRTPSVLEVVKAILQRVGRLSHYAGTTVNVDASARRLRAVAKFAKNPMEMLAFDIPEALELPAIEPEKATTRAEGERYARALVSALDTLQSLDATLEQTIDDAVRRLLGGNAGTAFYTQLASRAREVEELPSLPPETRRFAEICSMLNAFDAGSIADWRRATASLALGKLPSTWSDSDASRFMFRVLDLTRGFLAAEKLALGLGRGAKSDDMRLFHVAMLDAHGESRDLLAAVGADELKQARNVANRIARAPKSAAERRAHIAGVIACLLDDLALMEADTQPIGVEAESLKRRIG